MRTLLRIAPLVVLAPLLGVGVSACASASAKTQDRPDLVMPPPPPHVVPITPEPVVDPVADIPFANTNTPANRQARGARDTSPKAPPVDKPETKPSAELKPEAPIAEAPLPPMPAGPTPQLRAEGAATETTVRASVDRARNLLNTVDYRHLTAARRKAYDDAKAFAAQAEDALKAGNVVFAQGVATKAETLAKELAGR
jgi:hypothetical protein